MIVDLLNTEGFHNLQYCIRSKGFLELLEALLYPTVLEISAFGVKLKHIMMSGSKHVDRSQVGR